MPRRESLRSYSPCRAGVAQLVEQGTENPRVGSSILSPGTTWKYRACVDQTQALFRIHHTKGRPFPTGMTADLRVAVARGSWPPLSYRDGGLFPLRLYRKPRAPFPSRLSREGLYPFVGPPSEKPQTWLPALFKARHHAFYRRAQSSVYRLEEGALGTGKAPLRSSRHGSP